MDGRVMDGGWLWTEKWVQVSSGGVSCGGVVCPVVDLMRDVEM